MQKEEEQLSSAEEEERKAEMLALLLPILDELDRSDLAVPAIKIAQAIDNLKAQSGLLIVEKPDGFH